MPAASPALLGLVALLAATPSRASPEGGVGPQELRLHLVLSRSPHGTEAERDRLRVLEEELLGLLAAADAGTLARDAWPDGACVITIETRDARRAWRAVEAAVRAYGPLPGSRAVLRPGPAGTTEERVPLALGQARGEPGEATPPR